MNGKGRSLSLLFSFLLLATPFAWSADFEELQARLEEEGESPVAGELLTEAILKAPNIDAARRVFSLYRQRLSSDRQRLTVFQEMGSLEELAGNFDGALRNFEELLQIDPENDEIRLRSAAAALETGDYERARRHAQYVIDSARDREYQRLGGLYLALSYFNQGNRTDGLPIFRSLTRGESRRTVESRTLVYALLAARAWEAEEYARELEAKLDALYPSTLDRLAVASESGVSMAPRPSILLPAAPWEFVPPERSVSGEEEALRPREPGATPDSEEGASATPEEGSQEEPLVIGIQTGSFNDEANALVMRDEIREEGIPAQVREVELQGRQYYRVVVPTNGAVPPGEAQELVVRLKELGVEGFLLFAGE